MNTIILDTGSVEYSAEAAQTDIDDLIAALEEAKEDGATHVVLASGNHRGAKYMRVRADFDWVD